MKALFLDRDGVINRDTGHVYRVGEFVFLDGIFDLGREAMAKGYTIVVVTNQAGIGRGYYSEDEFHTLTAWLRERFASESVEITDVMFAPHHPEWGIGPYKAESPDRKPNPGMMLKAANRHRIDLAASVMVGDRASDMRAGAAAGIGRLVLISDTPDLSASMPSGVERFNSVAALVGHL